MTSFSDLRSQYVFKKRVYLSEAWADIPDPTEEDKRLMELHKGLWVDLREPSVSEAVALRKIAREERMDEAVAQMPVHICDHNFLDVDGKKVGSKEVVDYIAGSANIANHVLTQWMNSLPLTRRNAKS